MTYKREAFDMFDQLVSAVRRDVVAAALHAPAQQAAESERQAAQQTSNGAAAGGQSSGRRGGRRGGRAARFQAPSAASSAAPARSAADAVGARNVRESGGQSSPAGAATATVSRAKVGRNQPCPCGSGKKYKRCHGQAA